MNGIPMLDLPVSAFMTSSPAAIGPEDSLGDAAATMVQGGFRHLPVVEHRGRLAGILSERDLRARLGTDVERFPEASAEVRADRVEGTMRPDPVAVEPDTPLREVLRLLAEERIGALPVVDDEERLVGMVSYVDVLQFLRSEEVFVAGPSGAVPRAL